MCHTKQLIIIFPSYSSSITHAAQEGVHLIQHGISPYSGDTFHESPLFLAFYTQLCRLPVHWIDLFFITVDVMTAILLSVSSIRQLDRLRLLEQKSINHLKPVKHQNLFAISSHTTNIGLAVTCVYLLSPYALLVTTARSSGVMINFLISCLMLSVTLSCRLLSCLFASFLIYASVHHLPLIVATALILELQRSPSSSSSSSSSPSSSKSEDEPKIVYDLASILFTFAIFSFMLAGLLIISYFWMNESWQFIDSTYGFV